MDYIHKGDKILNSFSFFTDRITKLDNAINYYKQALKDFIIKCDFLNYALLAEKIGDEYIKIGDNYNGLKYYNLSEKKYIELDVEKYSNLIINKIIPLYIEDNKITYIAKSYYNLAKITRDDNNHIKTVDYFENAIRYYQSEQSIEIKDCYKDYANYLLDYGNIDYALKYLDLIIQLYLNNNTASLYSYFVDDYILLYILSVWTKNDTVLAKRKIDEYCELAPRFINSQIHKFIVGLQEIIENNDLDSFIEHITNYDLIKKLKPREVKLLLIIKKNFNFENTVDLS